jgi:hypothetical protein
MFRGVRSEILCDEILVSNATTALQLGRAVAFSEEEEVLLPAPGSF